MPASSDRIFAWESKGLLEEGIKPPDKSYNNLVLKLTFIHNSKIEVKFE